MSATKVPARIFSRAKSVRSVADFSEATAAVRRRMQHTARKDNPFERSVRSLLHAQGIRYRIHFPLPGLRRTSCDIAFPSLKIAVFLDGCFWHGCDQHRPVVKKNTDFWLEKIERNHARDLRATAHLIDIGWIVLRYWEHEAAENIAKAILSAVRQVRDAGASSGGVSRPLEDVQGPSGKFEAVDCNERTVEAQLRE
ncbi:very short patch repair endonuclease [Mesorhizobium sp. WSM4083]|uniref:very short patch repair endonuclease n=1 Tax=Mesorhizobium sp. WSM4083 TaxID=3446363 RepID=UPI0009E018FB